MQALAQSSRLGLKAPLQPKASPARHGKPLLGVSRGAVQSQAAAGGNSSLAPMYQLADVDMPAAPPVVLDAVIDAPPPAALEAAAAASEVLSAPSVAPEPNAAVIAVEAEVTKAVSEAATAVVDAASDAIATVTDAVVDTADGAMEAIADAVTAVTSTTTLEEAPKTLSLAAQRYAEMTSKAPKVAPGGGGSGGASFQAPSFSMPDLSDVQLPKVSVPNIPKLSAPDFSKFSVPELPKISAATEGGGDAAISLPKVDFSKLQLPAAPAFDVPNVGGAVGTAAADVSSAAAAAAASVGAAASSALSGVTSAVGRATNGAAAAINGATGGLLDELDHEVGEARAAVQAAAASVEATIGDTVSAVEASLGGAVGQVYEALPPQAQVVARDMGDVVYAFASHPTSSLVLAGLVGLPLGIKAYNDRYGGYSGDLTPAAVKELLIKEDVLVVDVRTEAERQESGVLELRKGARFSAAALPADTVTFSPKWARESKAGERLGTSTTALLISRLNRIRTPLTKVVIMNNNDDVAARDLARAVRAAGVLRVYVMAGGFQAWSAAGLGVVPGKTDYEASALVVLLDEVAEIAAVVGPKLREPAFLATTLATSSLVVYAAVNYHTTLRYFAVWGVFATIYWRLSQYNSPQEFLEDVKAGALAAASTTAGAASAAARAAASAAASKPSALASAAVAPASAAVLPAPAPAAGPAPAPKVPAPPPTAVPLPPPPPAEASQAALAAAMAAAGVAPLPPVAAPIPVVESSPVVEAKPEPPVANPAPEPTVVAANEITASAAMLETADSGTSASTADTPAPVSPGTNGNGNDVSAAVAAAADLGYDAKVAVPVTVSDPSAPTTEGPLNSS